MQHLFIYGTLALDRPDHHIMTSIRGTWQKASARGCLIAEGWGAAAGYPAIIPDAEGETVAGYLFSSHELSAHWERLDAFEGEGYQRVLIDVYLEDGTTCAAYVYALNDKDAKSAPRV